MTRTDLALPGPLVSTDWLAERLGHPGLVVVDASWYLPAMGRDAAAEYQAARIPGAIFFDIDALSESTTPLPHTLQTPRAFGEAIGAAGVSSVHTVVAYDGSGINLSAARAWWMFRVYGHERVAVLDGGLGKWRAEGRPLASGPPEPRARGMFVATYQSNLVWGIGPVLANLYSHAAQLVDARSAGRFHGTEPEPRPGVRGGHVPGSFNVPYPELVNPDGTLRSPAELRARFVAAGVDPDQPVAALCGSGVTACAVLLALAQLGNDRLKLYDGSWTEWGGRTDTPAATD